jgi:hypothetical protein
MVVDRHGALTSSSIPLRVGMKIEIHVIMTDKRAAATVVYIDSSDPAQARWSRILCCDVYLLAP